MTVNETFREHVTSVGFALILTKRQLEMLVLLHHFEGFKGAHEFVDRRKALSRCWVSTARGLQMRGLLPEGNQWELTEAGKLIIGLLKEADIYKDTLDRLGVETAVSA